MDIPENSTLMNTVHDIGTTKSDSQATLIMCEELRKLNKIDSIIPQPLLNVERPTNAVVVWKPQSIMNFVQSFSDYKEPKSSVVITEITDEEEKAIYNQEDMLVEDNNYIGVEDDEMEL